MAWGFRAALTVKFMKTNSRHWTGHWRDLCLHMVCVSSNLSMLSSSLSLTETFSDGRNERFGNPVLDGLGGPGHWTICIESSHSLIKMLSACCFWNFSKATFRGSCYAGNYRSSRWKRTERHLCKHTRA